MAGKQGRRIGVALHKALGPALAKAALDNGRSLSGMAGWIIFGWLKEHGYNVTTADLSDWRIEYIGGGPRGKAEAAVPAAQRAEQESNTGVDGRSQTRNEDPVPDVQRDGHECQASEGRTGQSS